MQLFTNQIAGSLFELVGGYETLCQELELETSQEKTHVAAFQKVCSKLKMALLGKTFIGNSQLQKTPKQRTKNLTETYSDRALRLLTKLMLRDYADYYSTPTYKNWKKKGHLSQVPTYGVSSRVGSVSQLKFFTLKCGEFSLLSLSSFHHSVCC